MDTSKEAVMHLMRRLMDWTLICDYRQGTPAIFSTQRPDPDRQEIALWFVRRVHDFAEFGVRKHLHRYLKPPRMSSPVAPTLCRAECAKEMADYWNRCRQMSTDEGLTDDLFFEVFDKLINTVNVFIEAITAGDERMIDIALTQLVNARLRIQQVDSGSSSFPFPMLIDNAPADWAKKLNK